MSGGISDWQMNAIQWRAHANELADKLKQALAERDEMRKAIMLAPREVVAQAVAYCRKAGALESKPLSGDVTQWSAFTTGLVYAAIEKAHG